MVKLSTKKMPHWSNRANSVLGCIALGLLSIPLEEASFGADPSLASPPTAELSTQQPFTPSTDPGRAPASEGKTKMPEAEDFSGTPFTEYGEFNQSTDEETDAQFLQFGRFFGVSLGLGLEAADGNRGILWQGGFPLVDFKVHYWFDFNFALALGFMTVNHFFSTASTGQINVNMFRVGLDLKYYFNTSNLSGMISFASPYLIAGIGSYSKSEYAPTIGAAPTILTSVGAAAGAGIEFTLSPKKSYLEIEGKINFVPFYDSGSSAYLTSNGIPNLSGNFWTVSTNVLLTW
jgi:hypothetical protein